MITAPHVDGEHTLRAIALDPDIEREIADALTQTPDGEFLAMDPERARALVDALKGQADHATGSGGRPVLLCSARVRRHLKRLIEQSVPNLAVCSYNEVMPGIQVETVGMVNA